MLPEALLPAWPDLQKVAERDREAKESYKLYYNKHGAVTLPELQPGDNVRIKLDSEKRWTTPGVVSGKASTPRSYLVDTP